MKPTWAVVAGVSLLLVVNGCATRYGAREVGTLDERAARAVPARAFLWSDEPPRRSIAPHAFLLLTARPAPPDGVTRAEIICQLYMLAFEPDSAVLEQLLGRLDDWDVAITYWPLAGSRQTPPNTCKRLVEQYDFPRAATLAAQVGKAGAAGPLLVAFPEGRDGDGVEPLVFDCSTFPTADIGEAFRVWKDRVGLDPRVWKRGWWLEVLRAEIRNTLGHAAEQMLAVVGKAPPSKPISKPS